MKAALAIAAAELRAHRVAILSGPLWGLMGHFMVWVVVPFLQGRRPRTPGPEFAEVLGGVVVMTMQMGLAVLLGAGAVARDLGERRMGFYLSRPVAPLAYWAAKVSAAFLAAYVAGWLVLLPGLVLDWSWGLVLDLVIARWRFVLAGAAVSAFVVAAAAAGAGAARSRSGLLLLDVIMLPLTLAALLLALGATWDAGTTVAVARYGIPWLFGLATLALLAASAAQISFGRFDVLRGHALLSTIMWGGLLACVGGIVAMSRLVANATPSDLRLPHGVSLHAPEAGTHVMLEGVSRRWSDYDPGFLLDAQGRFVRMGGLLGITAFAWSGDGGRLAWSKAAPDFVDLPAFSKVAVFFGVSSFRAVPAFQPSVWILDLDQPGAAPRRVASRPDFLSVRALSPSGRRLLITRPRAKTLVDVESGRTIASIGESTSWTNAEFLSETSVRALRIGPGQSRIVDWDAAGGRLTERGAIALDGDRTWFARLVPTDGWQRVLRFDASGLFLHDLDGKVVATLVNGWPTRMNRAAGPLSAGRFGSIEQEREGLRLRVFDSAGRALSEARFKGRFPLHVGGESAPGLLALGVAPAMEDGQRETLFVDLATGSVTRREPGLWPALRRWGAGRPGESQNPQPGSLATRLFLGDQGVLRLEPASGERTVLVPRSTS